MCRACGVRACTGRRAAAGLVPAGGPAAELTGRAWRVWARAQVLEQLAAESLSPTACTTIEEVGSTGVGALTIAFLILGVSTIVFISRVGSAKGQKVYYYCNVFVCGFATMAYFARAGLPSLGAGSSSMPAMWIGPSPLLSSSSTLA